MGPSRLCPGFFFFPDAFGFFQMQGRAEKRGDLQEIRRLLDQNFICNMLGMRFLRHIKNLGTLRANQRAAEK
jgi:hypothetical protein